MASNRRNLKAYVRYDGSGRIIPGGPIFRATKPKVGNWKEINAYQCCNPSPQPINALRLTFNSIENADILVGDSSSVADWNTFFDLPTYGNPFTSVEVVGNEVRLFGGSNINVKPGLMYGGYGDNQILIEINDEVGCITSVGGDAFSYIDTLTTVNLPACTILYGPDDSPENDVGAFGWCESLASLSIPNLVTIGDSSLENCNLLTSIDFPLVTTVGNSGIAYCDNLTSINLPLATSIGNFCFSGNVALTTINIPSCQNLGSTVGDDNVFNGINGNNITLTVPSALMTANAGNPDGDIVYLQANNTVTINTV